MPTVNIDGLRLCYRETGLGVPIVFLPGLTGSKEWFEPQFSGLSDSYRVLGYDYRQAGRQQYNIQLLVEDLAKFLSALRLPSAVIAGHSFGGLIAQQFALSYPQRAKSLLLISTFPRLQQSHENIQDRMIPDQIEFQSPTRTFVSRILRRRRQESTPLEGLEYLAANTADITKATLNERIRIVREFDSTDRLPEMTMPALIIAGAKDNSQALESAQVLYENMADATLEVIEDAGHFCFYERHDIFNDIVDSFLSEHMMSLG